MAKATETKLAPEKILQFRECLLLEREKPEQKVKAVKHLAIEVAKKLTLDSQLKALACATLAHEVKLSQDQRNLERIGFLIELVVAVSYDAANANLSGYDARWFSEFKAYFLTVMIDVPFIIPEVTTLKPEIKGRFGEMLVVSMALFEDTGKCGTLTLKKCAAYHTLKQWGESWVRGGFSTSERNLIAELLIPLKRVAQGHGLINNGPTENEKRLIKENEAIKNEKRNLETQLVGKINLIGVLNNEKSKLDDEIANLRAKLTNLNQHHLEEIRCKEVAARNREEELILKATNFERRWAELDNQMKIGQTQLLNALRPIYQQYAQVKNTPMSIDLGECMREFMGRIFDEMNAKGFTLN